MIRRLPFGPRPAGVVQQGGMMLSAHITRGLISAVDGNMSFPQAVKAQAPLSHFYDTLFIGQLSKLETFTNTVRPLAIITGWSLRRLLLWRRTPRRRRFGIV